MDDIVTRLERMGAAIAPYSKAKADRVYIEKFLRSKIAMLIQDAPEDCTTVSAKEAYAYSHPEYLELLDGLREAVEVEETAKFTLEQFKIQFEMWRTEQANDRYLKDRI